LHDETDDELNKLAKKANDLQYGDNDDMTFVFLGAACLRDDFSHAKSFILAVTVNLLFRALLRHIH
jgi:hypothetical protein